MHGLAFMLHCYVINPQHYCWYAAIILIHSIASQKPEESLATNLSVVSGHYSYASDNSAC